jgi:hypothetical protein
MKKFPYLVTFPRSGSHYFDEIIYKEIGIHIEKSHSVSELFDENNQKKRKIITIVRNPIDTLLSYRASELRMSNPPSESTQKARTREAISEYILLNNFLYEHADYTIDFNDLVTCPDSVAKRIISLLEIDEEDYKFFDRDNYWYEEEYLPSSKVLPSYSKNLLDGFDLGLCNFYYNKVLEKKITV